MKIIELCMEGATKRKILQSSALRDDANPSGTRHPIYRLSKGIKLAAAI
jgi:hypothetical protein